MKTSLGRKEELSEGVGLEDRGLLGESKMKLNRLQVFSTHSQLPILAALDSRYLAATAQPQRIPHKGQKVAWWSKRAVPSCDFERSSLSAPNLSPVAADAGNSFNKE